MLAAIAVTGAYAWANYLHLKHYLLVPFLVAGILAGVALDGVASAIAGAVAPDRRRVAGGAVVVAGGARRRDGPRQPRPPGPQRGPVRRGLRR